MPQSRSRRRFANSLGILQRALLACGCGRGAVALGLTVATLSQLPQQRDEPDGPAAAAALTAVEPDDHVLDLVDQLSAWERIDEAKKALRTFKRAVQLLPHDGAPRTMLGMWFYEVSQLNWFERQAVKAGGQTVPAPSEGLRQALHWLLEADALYNSCLNDLMLGKTLLAMSDPERARTYVERAARRAPREQSDVKAQLEATQLLQTWSD
ncbi:hypothetical protein FOCC_FOCC006478 [Frankliniella occidentalis]|nr:hypothetical protein FOCC_FOCC006478 [Frankliniella occidentalis]